MTDNPQFQQLRGDITACKQLKSMSMKDYYSQLMGLFDDPARLKPLHGCTYGKCCLCDVTGRFVVDRKKEKLHQFFIGVDDDLYATVR